MAKTWQWPTAASAGASEDLQLANMTRAAGPDSSKVSHCLTKRVKTENEGLLLLCGASKNTESHRIKTIRRSGPGRMGGHINLCGNA